MIINKANVSKHDGFLPMPLQMTQFADCGIYHFVVMFQFMSKH